MNWNAETPYNDLPILPPDLERIETRSVLKACIGARAAIAELKTAGELIPDQGLLINILPMLEAKDSSRIENIVTTSDQLFQYADRADGADPATKEALRYRTALYDGYTHLEDYPLCTNTAVAICTKLRAVQTDIRKTPGTVLRDQNNNVVYTPPVGEDAIRELLANWERFIHGDDDLDPLVKMAIAHYQFECIHPFPDGNGRTGRILNILYLIQSELLSLPILYLSRFILERRDDYYTLLRRVTEEGDWESWILFMLEAVESTSRWTTDKISIVRALMAETTEYVREKLPKIYTHELVQALFAQPYCRIDNLVERGVAKRQTASTYLKQLVEIGVLEEMSVGREKLYINTRLLQELNQ
ncbi:addiction module protein [Salmonella enterica subsp. enterica serovar Legon]|uniref:protein adenylyltransferase Fic n=1 Tax=Salmonella enterica TaxID=28901 RepID=UPI000D3ED701|nr:Fic family protein [Salmonella enterica]PVB76026.1 addiction module protein [Salmonella enterica subsp. enterica serovar Legon]PVB88644.1 addiction module protein [Salmonella enterica subsp. enterica serovar Legon]PVB92348.1 addiction module protein [Salmonella enterica subsp. enterica serovar Legon]PVB98597.1 addiction module protein [Salmonella enterica subsp. enterica serovar Legon]PVC06184.1 addiction module protein [Salmonella enterica subsp. enterica serovar Legon]